MPYILGLDPSLRKTGFSILNSEKPDNVVEEKGLLKTTPRDGITVQRLIKQAEQIGNKIKDYNIKYVGMEAPFFSANSTEMLYALNQYIHKIFLDNENFVVCFPPQQLKKLVFPDKSVSIVGKPHMIHRAKSMLNLHGKRLAEDVADAYWAAYFGKKFYKFYFEKSINEKDLSKYERKVFCGKHVYKRGQKKGLVDYTGIIYRENELFFDFKKIKGRLENAQKTHKEEKPKAKNKNGSRSR